MSITVAMRTEISQLYVSLFGRAPDGEGLGFWVNSYSKGNTLANIAQSMYDTAPARAYYPLFATPSEIVTTFYTNVLGRAPDTEGLAFWVKEYSAATSQGAFFSKLISNVVNYTGTDAAGVTSKSLFANKVAVAQFYGEQNGTVAGATAALNGVTSVATSVDTAKAAILNTPVTGQAYTLNTSVDAVSGGAGNDTISGLLGSSATYTVGDNIIGGSGTDTLNLIAVSGTDGDGGLVTLNGVETVNVRLLTTAYGSAGDQLSLNAADWTGVTTLSNASSLANTQLDVSGLTDDTIIVLNGNTDINVAFNNTATGATANAVLVNAGSAGTATTIASASATNTANFDFDQGDTGFVTNVNLEVRGTLNLARIEAGSSAATFTVTGTGNAALVTDDTITSFDASAAAGNIDITFAGASDVVAKGGAGADTFRFGTTISSNDSVNGGLGSDTVALTIGGFTRNLNTTNVEVATITFSDANGGTANGSAASVTTYNLVAGSSSADASISEIVNGATIVLGANANGLDDVTIDGASGAATMTINFGTASGGVSISGLSVTDIATVTIAALSNTTGTNVISSATFDSDAKSVLISTNGGDADLTMTAIALGGVTSLSITTNGSAGFTMQSAIDGATALTQVSLAASGTGADITLNTLGSGIGLTTILIDANAGADIFASGVTFGNSASATIGVYTISVDAENGSVVGTAAAAGAGLIVTTTAAASVNFNVKAQASSTVHIGDLVLLQGSIATASAAGGIITISAGTIETNAIVRFEEVNSSATFTGTQLVVSSVVLGVSAQLVLWSGGVAATGVSDFDIGALNITLGQSAIAEISPGDTFEITAGSFGSITVVAADGASATFAAIEASAVGAISVSVASGASANFDNIDLVAAAGTAANVGSIELGGVDGGGVTFGTIQASGVGAIAASGALDVVFGTITTTTIGSVNASNMTVSGAFTIDLSGVVNAAEVILGAATNVVISGAGNDTITLKAGGTGNDTIRFAGTAGGKDSITNFFAGSTGADKISIAVAVGTAGIFDGDGSAQAAADVIDLTVVINGTGASATLVDDNIIVLGTAFASTGALLTWMATAIVFGTAAIATAGVIVAWSDGNSDTYISYVDIVDAGSANATTIGSAAATTTEVTLAVISGVTPGALNAANFVFV